MSTGTIILPMGAADVPDGTANNAAPLPQWVKSSAAAPTPYFRQWAFSDTIRMQLSWSFQMPVDYASTPTLQVQFKMASAITNAVVIEARLAATTPGDATDQDTKAFGTANTSSAVTVPATTAGKVTEISLPLANDDGLAAGDFVIVYLARDAVHASDNAAGNMEVISASITYTTT